MQDNVLMDDHSLLYAYYTARRDDDCHKVFKIGKSDSINNFRLDSEFSETMSAAQESVVANQYS